MLVRRHWFLTALLILIPGGIAVGMLSEQGIERYTRAIEPRWITAIALFLMAFTLDSSQLSKSPRSPWPVSLATVTNFGFMPLVAIALAPMQLNRDFEYGLVIAASVPCTMAAASVWTRQAVGNDAVSLLVTLLTNSLCVVITPFWLRMGTGADVELGFSDMVLRLLMAVLIPGLLGQLLRLFRLAREFAVRRKSHISVVAMGCILLLVFASACDSGQQLRGSGTVPNLSATALVWISCIFIHLAAMALAVCVARMTGVSAFDQPAVAFASSQKTLPIGVLLAREPSADAPFAVFPMLMFHTSQLIIDTAIAHRMARSRNGQAERKHEAMDTD